MRVLALIVLVGLVAGCAGSRRATYDFQATQRCLGGRHAQLRLPGVPQTFGDLRVATRGDVLFAPSPREARAFFALERRGDAQAVLRKNAVVVWASLATPTWRQHLLGCLR